MKVTLVFLLSFFATTMASAKPIEFREQMAIANYAATALKELPANELKFSKILPGLSPADQTIAKKIMHDWTLNKRFQFSRRLNQVMVKNGDRVLLTMEATELSPLVITLNGSQRISIDKNDVAGSLMRALKPSKGHAGLYDLLKRWLVGADAYADGDAKYMTSNMSGLGQALFLYSGVIASSSAQDNQVWMTVQDGESWRTRNFGNVEHNFTCPAKDDPALPISGKMYIDGVEHGITYSPKDGLVVDQNLHVSVSTHEMTADQAIHLPTYNAGTCLAIMNQINKKTGYEETVNTDNCTLNLRDSNVPVQTTQLKIERCSNGSCAPSDIESLRAVAPESTDIQKDREQVKQVQTKLDAAEDKFKSDHGLDDRLGLDDQYQLKNVPPSSQLKFEDLSTYRDQIAPLAQKIDKFNAAIAGSDANRSEHRRDQMLDAERPLYDAMRTASAIWNGCKDPNFRIDAGTNHGLNLEPADSAK